MDKKEILICKLNNLCEEIELAKKIVDGGYIEYLENYKNFACSLVKKIDDGLMPESNGGLLGVMRAVSEYDNLASIKSLYDAAYEADAYYSSECREW